MGKSASNCVSSLAPITSEQDEEIERLLLGGMPHPPIAMPWREEMGQVRGDDIEREEESLLPREYSPTSGWRTPRELKERGWEQSLKSQIFLRTHFAPSCDGSSNQDGKASSRSRSGDWSCEALPPPLKFTSMSLDHEAASKMRAGGRRWLSNKGGAGSGSTFRIKAPVPTGLLRHLAYDSQEGSSRKMLGPWAFFVNSVAGRAAHQSMAMALSAWKRVVMAGKVEAESAQCAAHGIDLLVDVGGAGSCIEHPSGSLDPIYGSELAGSHREAAENRQGIQPCIAQARADKTEVERPSKLSRESKTVSWRDQGRGRPAYSQEDILSAAPAASFAPRGTVHAVAGVSHHSELERRGLEAGMFSLSLEENREIERLLAGGSVRESAAGRRTVDAMVPAAFSVTPRAMAYQWHTPNARSHASLRVSLVNAGRRQGVETPCADMEDEHEQPLAVPPGPTPQRSP